MGTTRTSFALSRMPAFWELVRAYQKGWHMRVSIRATEQTVEPIGEEGTDVVTESRKLPDLSGYLFIVSIGDAGVRNQFMVVATVSVSRLDVNCHFKGVVPPSFTIQIIINMGDEECFDRHGSELSPMVAESSYLHCLKELELLREQVRK